MAVMTFKSRPEKNMNYLFQINQLLRFSRSTSGQQWHQFIKKSDRTPRKELEIARQRMREVSDE